MMNSIPAVQSALSGIHSGLQNLNRNAEKIADASTSAQGSNITEPLVNMISDKQLVQASVKALQTTNSMLGTLLDLKV